MENFFKESAHSRRGSKKSANHWSSNYALRRKNADIGVYPGYQHARILPFIGALRDPTILNAAQPDYIQHDCFPSVSKRFRPIKQAQWFGKGYWCLGQISMVIAQNSSRAEVTRILKLVSAHLHIRRADPLVITIRVVPPVNASLRPMNL